MSKQSYEIIHISLNLKKLLTVLQGIQIHNKRT